MVLHVPFDRAEEAWKIRSLQHLICRMELFLEEGE